MNQSVAVILVNYKDYAKKYLPDCVKSWREQDYAGGTKLFIVDNETSEETARYLLREAPEAELVLNKQNDGFAKGNNDAIKLALAQGFDYIMLLNMDTVMERACLRELVAAMESDREILAAQARLMLFPEKELVNSLGNTTHFLGFGYCLGYREKWHDGLAPRITPIVYPSGAAVLCRRETFAEAGLFDEEFWMYNEDQDLGWRIWLTGRKCALAPRAAVYHKYEFAKSIRQYYWMDRNRLLAIWKNYHILTLVLVLPALLFMEAGLALFSLKTGWFKRKLAVWGYFLNPARWPYLWRTRRESQRKRRAGDREIIKMFTGRIWYQEIDDWKLRAVNPIFDAYWKFCRYIIFW